MQLQISRLKEYITHKILAKGYFISSFKQNQERQDFMRFLATVYQKINCQITYLDAINLKHFMKYAQNIKGDIVEVGVYNGASALILAKLKHDKTLYLFDTFEGVPDKLTVRDTHKVGQYKAAYKDVEELFYHYARVYIHKGIFPQQTSKHIPNKTKFALVNIDVDIENSAKDCLNYFYPKMTKHGVIIVHDYSIVKSVRFVVNKFLEDKPEFLIETNSTPIIIIKQ